MTAWSSDKESQQGQLQHRRQIETTLSQLSARFVSFTDLNEAILRSLADMGKLMRADLAFISLIHNNNSVISNTYEWVRPGLHPIQEKFQNLSINQFNWVLIQLKAGKIISIPDVAYFPPEAKAERELFDSQSIKSILIFPLTLDAEIGGFLGIATIQRLYVWEKEDVRILRVASEIIGRALTRKQVEDALQISEERFKAQFMGFPVPTFTWARRRNEFILINYNHAAERITRGAVEKYLGKTAREMYSSRHEIIEDLDYCYQEKTTIQRELRYTFESGQERDLAVTYVYIDPDLILVHTEDITERKKALEGLQEAKAELELHIEQRTSELRKANEQLQREKERFKAQFNATPIPVYLWQYIKDKEDFILIDSNEAAEEITESHVSHFIGRMARDMYRYRPEIRKDLVRCYREKTTIKREMQYRYETSEKLMDLAVTYVFIDPDLVMVHTENISDQKRALEALKKSEEQLRMQYKGLPIPTFTYQWNKEKNDFILIDFNDMAEILTEGQINYYLGKSAQEQHHANPEILGDLAHCFAEKIIIQRERFYRFITDGKPKYLSLSYVYITPDLVMLHAENISARRQAETALKESEDRYRRLVEYSPEPMLVHSDMKFVYANVACLKLLGATTVEEILGKSIFEVIHPDAHQSIVHQLQHPEAAEQPLEPIEYTVVRYDGELRDVEAIPMPITWYGRPAWQVILRDFTERKHTLDALKTSEERYRSLIDLAPEGIVTINQKGIITSCNPTGLRLSGYSHEELVGTHITKLNVIPKEDLPSIVSMFNSALLGKITSPYEIRFRRNDGTYRWGEVHTQLQKVEGQIIGVLVILRDITARQKAEYDLRTSERRYRLLAENMSDVLWTASLDLKASYVSPSCKNLLGYTGEEVMEHWLEGVIVPKSMQLAKQTIEAELSRGTQNFVLELQFLNKDGSTVWTESRLTFLNDPDGRTTGILGVTRDITERQMAEDTLREREAQYSALVEQAQDGVIIAQNQVIKFVNQAVTEELGYTIDQLLGRPFVDLIAPEFKEMISKRLQTRIAGEDVPSVYEAQIICKDGSRKDFEISSGLIQYEGRLAYMGLIRNITTRKQAEEMRLDLERRRTEFIAMVSHELRTPLTSIRGYSELLAGQLDQINPEKQTQCFEAIARNVDRLEHLITGVSTLGQIERGPLLLDTEDLDICQFLTEALQPYMTFLGSRLIVITQQVESPVLIEADPGRLLQVIDNLLENARKHTDPTTCKITVNLETFHNRIRVLVSDNGAGIAPDDMELVFNQFVSLPTKYAAAGTGIGLYLSRVIVEAHGGTLTAQSEGIGKGATFIIELPRKNA